MSIRKEKMKNPLHIVRNLWYMMKYTFKYTPTYIVVTLCEAFGRGADHIIRVLFTKYLFDSIELGVEFKTLLFWILLVAGYQATFELFNKWRLAVYVPKAKLELHEGIQNEMYMKAREMDLSCYDDPDFYNDFIWAIRESDIRTAQIMENLSIFINRVVSSAAILGILVSLDWIVSMVLLMSVTMNFILVNKINRVKYNRNVEMTPFNRKLSYIGRVFYLQDYAKELRQGCMASHLCDEYNKVTEEKVSCMKKYMTRIFVLTFAVTLLTDTIVYTGVTSFLIIRYIVDPTLTLGSFSASITACYKLYWTLRDIGNYLSIFNEHSLYVEKVRRFIECEPKVKGEDAEVPPFVSLKIEKLNFAYPFAKECENVLTDISLEIKKGEKIAFVGYNGAGKTTLIMLLMRLYDPSEGLILYNGQDIRRYIPEKYRERIGAVFQDYKVFAASVAENVMGDEYREADEEIVKKALKAVSFESKLKQLPNGIYSQITTEFSKEGVGLSGGEAQKIAISRIFARSLDLVIMDEPSSSLDPVAEYELNQSIMDNIGDKTVIFISHRLATTRMSDRIYMFSHGRIIEQGSHEELMCQNGKYAEMYRVQAKKYNGSEIK